MGPRRTPTSPLARLGAAALLALLALAACGGPSASPSVTSDDTEGEGALDAATPDPLADGGLAADDASRPPDAPDAPGIVCTSPLDSDASLATLTTVDLASYCVGPAGLTETGVCDGLVEVSTFGVDCATGWVFDATTGALESTSRECNGHAECSMAPGFAVPVWCLGSAAWSMRTNLCADGG